MSHTHKFASAEWPFAEEPNVVAITTVHVLESQLPIVLVTHEPDIASHARRLVRFKDGRIVEDVAVGQQQPEPQMHRDTE